MPICTYVHGKRLRYLLGFLFATSFQVSVCLAQDAREVARKVLPSVVVVTTYDSIGRPLSYGSGFFVTSDIVATNFHVIDGASEADIKVVGNSATYKASGVVGISKQRDLVLLKVSNVHGAPLTLVASNQTEVGEVIYAIGNPKGFDGTISPGIVSSMGTRRVEGEDLIQLTTPISQGSSGGPVVNKRGEVIGVASMTFGGGQNLNFAVPATYLAALSRRWDRHSFLVRFLIRAWRLLPLGSSTT